MSKGFTKYRATYYNTSVDKEGERKYKDLGTTTFMHFNDSKIVAVSKAYIVAEGAQKDANAVSLTVIEKG